MDKNKIFTILLSIVLMMINTQCEIDKSVTETDHTVIFIYQAFDSLGTEIIRGWLEMDFSDSSHITGDRHLHKTSAVENTGPQIGDGKLEGKIANDTVSVNLNPEFVDNNVILLGTATEYVLKGKWSWITIAGVTNWGEFKAIKDLPD